MTLTDIRLLLCTANCLLCSFFFFFFQAEDGIRDLVRSRGLGDVYKRQGLPVGDGDHARLGRWHDEAGGDVADAGSEGAGQGLSLIHI